MRMPARSGARPANVPLHERPGASAAGSDGENDDAFTSTAPPLRQLGYFRYLQTDGGSRSPKRGIPAPPPVRWMRTVVLDRFVTATATRHVVPSYAIERTLNATAGTPTPAGVRSSQ